ncbi:hypothetical protein B0H11DRAFT_1933139 [Mycena galericulata]|nr:hypothetical protein B0H11DRAFT_1933139 [Mycena galericulata]
MVIARCCVSVSYNYSKIKSRRNVRRRVLWNSAAEAEDFGTGEVASGYRYAGVPGASMPRMFEAKRAAERSNADIKTGCAYALYQALRLRVDEEQFEDCIVMTQDSPARSGTGIQRRGRITYSGRMTRLDLLEGETTFGGFLRARWAQNSASDSDITVHMSGNRSRGDEWGSGPRSWWYILKVNCLGVGQLAP